MCQKVMIFCILNTLYAEILGKKSFTGLSLLGELAILTSVTWLFFHHHYSCICKNIVKLTCFKISYPTDVHKDQSVKHIFNMLLVYESF